MPQSPLVVVSNRLPVTARRRDDQVVFTRSTGGLASALDAALEEGGGCWIGWPGLPDEELHEAGNPVIPSVPGRRYIPVPLSRHEVSRYYAQFANRTLWPAFHYFLGYVRHDAAAWSTYDRVNEKFAQVAAREADPDALVWIHDYQLLRAPHHLRQLRPGARIAFFLHIPFPAADVFRALPWCRPLLRGLLASDYIGLHTAAFAAHLFASSERLLGCETDRARGIIHFEGRVVTVGVHPVGIDAASVEQAARKALAEDPADPAAPRLILGVDRLDYTKGILQRLLAVELLLERWPKHRGRVVFTQIAVPTRERVPEYGLLKQQIDEAVGRINGRFSEAGWTPIRYRTRPLDPLSLAGLYARTDVALVTPLRDGMNLVAKEYVAAQVANPGVLILSELAGAAEELQEAVLVNPFDVDGMADALAAALEMPVEERRARMAALRDRVRTNDVVTWRKRFISAAEHTIAAAASIRPLPVEILIKRLGPWLGSGERAALFLDFDGTLTPIVSDPDSAHLDTEAQRVLLAVAEAPHLDVAVVSGRMLSDLRARVPNAGLTLVGNHGLELEGPGIQWWHTQVEEWTETLQKAGAELDRLKVPGARLEAKGATLTWHLRAVPEPDVERAVRRGSAILSSHGLRVSKGKAVLEGYPPVGWNKGRAILYLLLHRYGEAWPTRIRALCIGDDTTDEDAFRALRGLGRSIRVGDPSTPSDAEDRLPDPAAVIRLLTWLAAGGHLGLRA